MKLFTSARDISSVQLLRPLRIYLSAQYQYPENLRCYASRTSDNHSESELEAARKWFYTFKKSSLPVKIAKTTFSRASGPGGQKTNKTSSKATTVWPLDLLIPHIPSALHADLKKSRYFISSSQSLSIQCDSHRSQSFNEAETHKRLYHEINEIYHSVVPGTTSPEQRKRVEKLKKSENYARIQMKKQHSAKKSSRKCISTGNM
ncbi:hypothetical protein GcC1_030003 [Golovinomyces cichoracearum]|uniref:Prokaryotic-type class I peptide chain release factors domain-containing protein n=1 Tax=Golovinomyces cichoracearum TaxID=62708 RepID=A0A420J2L9_9PEZI|nr:hypothetical protein GcC1_030003 [Golovinomyces cichoracearum]